MKSFIEIPTNQRQTKEGLEQSDKDKDKLIRKYEGKFQGMWGYGAY